MKSLYISLLTSAIIGSQSPLAKSNEQERGWIIHQKLTKMQYDTQAGLAERSGVTRKGLMSVKKSGSRLMETYWENGAFSQTIVLDGKKIVDGFDLNRVSRIRSLRLNKFGSVALLESGKGPKAKVTLKQDGEAVFAWPRESNISIIYFDEKELIYSQQLSKSQATKFAKFSLNKNGTINPDQTTDLGELADCLFLSAKPFQDGLAIEAICDDTRGIDIYFLKSGEQITPLADGELDEDLNSALLSAADKKQAKDRLGVLSVKGSPTAVQLYHSVNSSLLKDLGEPVSYASDEAGKQAWNQSYRTMALGTLFEKTRHPVFAALANRAMSNTLNTQNRNTQITGEANPDCAWASRIYSEDRTTPLSFMINQAMISGSLIRTCKALGDGCADAVRKRVDENAICLAKNYETLLDEDTQLYKIPKKIPFRFDGIWSPWNWQLSFAFVLEHAGQIRADTNWSDRAHAIVKQFYTTVEHEPSGALWRYWTPQYYDGWTEQDDISSHRPKLKPKANERYEDINHAGISLMALCEFPMSENFRSSTKSRLKKILDLSGQLPRDMDGAGPKNPKWFPSAGWDCLGSEELEERFSRYLPYAAGGSKHAAYARLFDPAKPFDLTLELNACDLEECLPVKSWTFSSPEDYLANSPFFEIIAK